MARIVFESLSRKSLALFFSGRALGALIKLALVCEYTFYRLALFLIKYAVLKAQRLRFLKF
jgi:hypothetical protein